MSLLRRNLLFTRKKLAELENQLVPISPNYRNWMLFILLIFFLALDDRTRLRELEKSHDPSRGLIFVLLKKGLETHTIEFKCKLKLYLISKKKFLVHFVH